MAKKKSSSKTLDEDHKDTEEIIKEALAPAKPVEAPAKDPFVDPPKEDFF